MNIRSLIAQKEKELHEINDYRVSTLEEELRRREKAEVTVRAKFGKLKEDFMYNLKLIEDRDAELDRYEANFDSLKGVIRSKDNDLNELRTELADTKSQLDSERNRSKTNDGHYETKMRDMTEALEKAKWAQEDDERRQREVLDACKRDLAQQLREKDELLLKQRQEMNISHDEVMRKREEEFRRQEEVLRARVEELEKSVQESKVEANNAQNQLVQKCREADRLTVELADTDRARKHAVKELDEARTSKNEEIMTLESEKRELAQVKQSLLDEYEAKMGELLGSLHSVERAFVQQREQFDLQLAQAEQERSQEMERNQIKMEGRNDALLARVAEAEQQTAKMDVLMKSSQAKYEDQIRTMRDENEVRLKEITASLTKQEEVCTDLKNQLWNRDLQFKNKNQEATKLGHEIEKMRDEGRIARQQLNDLGEQNKTLQRENMDLNLRWEQRWEEERTREAQKHTELTTVLQQQRDHLAKEKRELEERIVELETEWNKTRAELNAVRAHSRLAASLDNGEPARFQASFSIGRDNEPVPATETRAPPPAPQGPVPGAPPPPSPLFSEDMGPPSPLKPYEMGDTPVREQASQPRYEGPQATTAAFDAPESPREVMMAQENNRLKRVIGQMRNEMESMKDLADAKDDVAFGIAENQSRAYGTGARQLATKRLQQRGFDLSSFGTDEAVEQEENSALRAKLNDASNDLKRLMGEREKLLSISNNLKSELNRVQTEQKGSQMDITEAISGAEKETAKRYESKIATIEHRLSELGAHNKALTGELSKWSMAGRNSIFAQPGILDGDDTGEPQASVELATDGPQDLGESVDWSLTQSQEFDDDAAFGDEESIAEAIRNKMKIYREKNLTEQAEEDKRRLRSRSARERLQRAREGLELAGKRGKAKGLSLTGRKAPSSHTRHTGSISKRATASQERVSEQLSARQKAKERRKQLTAERKRVRNYNDLKQTEEGSQ
jgi:hypothetical protein